MADEPELVENHTDDDTNGFVSYLQQMLQHHGYYLDGQVDGIFGPITDAAVRQFQQDNELSVDGWVGPITWGVLTGEAPATARLEFDLQDYPAIERMYTAYEQAGNDETALADTHLAMVGVDVSDTDEDGTAYA